MDNELYQVLIEGKTEFIGEYSECFEYLQEEGYNLLINDCGIITTRKIFNKNELKTAYSLLNAYKKQKYSEYNSQMIKFIKKAIRFYYKSQTIQKNCLQSLKNGEEFRFFTDKYGDSSINCYIIDEKPTKDEIEEYFSDNSKIWSPYDCSGQNFMYSLDIFPLKSGNFLVKEYWTRDV